MDVLGVPIRELDETVLDRLVAEAVHEDQRLEYKVMLPKPTDEDRLEFLRDVSAFANAPGGALIYGVAANKGTASAIIGLSGADLDAEVLRLEQTLASGLRPRITGLVMQRVKHTKGPVLVVGVPRSLAAPHMVWAQETGQFWSRNNGGKFLMDVTQVRQAMLAASAWERAAADFREMRIDRIRKGIGVRALNTQSGAVILHVLPLGGPRDRVDLPRTKPNWSTVLYPGGATIGAPAYVARPNADGWLVSSAAGARHVQVFREGGGLEVRLDLTTPFKTGKTTQNGDTLNGNLLEGEIAKWVRIAVLWFEAAAIEPPFVVLVTLLNVEGAVFNNTNPNTSLLTGDYMIDVPDVRLPEQFLDRLPEDVAVTLAPTFDAMWQAASWPRSASRADDGTVSYAQTLAQVNWPNS